MTAFGLTVSSEEHAPAHLVEIARQAEEFGFDFVSISDHFHPWIGAQGHSPFVWSVLGAISQATRTIEVGVGVSCPTMRIHPAVSAHAAATTAALLPGRFVWGVGTGENLNEHVTGAPWPTAAVRLEMLEEAIEITRRLWTEDAVDHRGTHFNVEDARIFDKPDPLPPIVVSAFGPKAAKVAAEVGEGLWTTGIKEDVLEAYRGAGGDGQVWSQLSVCWDPDPEAAVERAHRIWPNTGLPGQLAQDLRTVLHFEEATSMVRREDMESSVPCGPDPDPILDSISAAVDIGVDHVYLHQIGDPLDGFMQFWAEELRPNF